MKISEILKSVGSSILKNAFPPLSGMAFDVINAATGGKLTGEETGDEVKAIVNSLPPEQQVSLLEKKLEVEITEIKEFTKVQEVLANADSKGASTRPWIAKLMAVIVAISLLAAVTAWAFAVYKDPKTLSTSWPLLVAILGFPMGLLNSYFGKRTKEKEKRYEMAGAPQNVGWVSDAIKMFRGK